MAVTSSGEIKFSDLAAEFGDDPPYQFSEFYRGAGKVPDVNTNVAASGKISLSQFYGAVNELLQTVTANASINAQTIFGSDWGTNIPKRLSIPSGVTIGPLTIPSGMGGTLEVDVAGNIYGTGGSANGGAGGHAITSNTSFTLNVLSGGSVRGGGGGGGAGGTGGGGQYTETVTNGPFYSESSPYYNWEEGVGSAPSYIRWGSGIQPNVYNAFGVPSNPYGIYYRGAFVEQYYDGSNRWDRYRVYQQYDQTVNSTGGAGGAGGVGQGYSQSAATGSAGSAGGTNAGTGGTGGSGGGFGSAGSTGNTGANGNRTNGSAGSGGGAAGRAVLMNAGTVTVNNSGTINGAY